MTVSFLDKHNEAIRVYRLGHVAEAVRLLHLVLRQDPTDGPTNHLMGKMALGQKVFDVAVDYLSRAVQKEPTNGDFHKHLARAFYASGRLSEALAAGKKAVLLRPSLPGTHYVLGRILSDLGRHREAVACLRQSVKLAPQSVEVRLNLAAALHRGGQKEEAITEYKKALDLGHETVDVHLALATLLLDVDQVDAAIHHCDQALKMDPHSVAGISLYADLLETMGRLDEAERMVRQGFALTTEEARLHLTAARIHRRKGKIEKGTLSLEAMLESGDAGPYTHLIHLELGQLLDLNGDTEKAFAHFVIGNRLATDQTERENQDVDKNRFLRRVDALAACCGDSWSASCTHFTESIKQDSPVFLVGFPRSGTTLLEQILGSHPAIQTLEEKPFVYVLRKQIDAIHGGYPDGLATLNGKTLESLRSTYFEQVNRHIEQGSQSVLVDKFPLNIVDVPLIWRLFPNAKFVLAIRHPCDVCLSCFMQPFQLNDAMANFFSLEDAANLYIKVMNLWQQYTRHIPIRTHTVRYEDLVDDLPTATRSILEFIDVPWDNKVLQHVEHAQKRTRIRTPSYHQVTQPIYTHATFRWRRYANQMQTVAKQLQTMIETFGY